MVKPVRYAPMLRVAFPLLLGVLCATQFSIPLLYTLLLMFFSAAFFMWLRIRVLIYPLIFGFGLLVALLRGSSGELGQIDEAELTIKVGEARMAKVIAIYCEQDEQWHSCNHKALLLGVDSLSHSTLVTKASVAPMDRDRNYYFRFLHNQQIYHQVTPLELRRITKQSPPQSVRLNRWAISRLELLKLNEEAFALAAAMSLSRRELLDDQTVQLYRRSGTSHIMALSGMHMSIVLLLVWWIFLPFSVANRGHLASSAFSIVAIWLFAFMAGLGDSILRAAVMFSLLQLSLIFSKRYGSLNSLCTTLVIIICCDPFALYDLGFQLSFICVAAIVIVGAPITRTIHTQIFLLDRSIRSLIIGSIATISILPLVSHYFGYIALLSPFATVMLLPTLIAIISLSLLWVLFPVAALAPFFRAVIESAVTIQNYLAEWFASLGWGMFEVQISGVFVLLSYLLLCLFVVYLYKVVFFKKKY